MSSKSECEILEQKINSRFEELENLYNLLLSDINRIEDQLLKFVLPKMPEVVKMQEEIKELKQKNK